MAKPSFWQWNSPVPYVYCFFAFLLVLLACALVILFCSHETPSSSESKSDAEEKETRNLSAVDPEIITVLVVLPGHANPMYVAKPLASSTAASAANHL